ncbi:helix-turn-helix transcriptional regulator [Acidovorax sp. Leaf78]|uniref:helix-turn-helix domain-containing protein n=1 Tax=Acidovorax sp. Leaf78 TaxID=1736237 RepID=UPI0006FC7AF6|nr:helix-turn-helix transcriptional regulator [Acidovorax sp. Leaf78]KQO23477.1 hypothetical protein ASF16_04760 [Acidovorax sp. Leaf78]
MSFTEHWRLRLQELLASTGLTQAAFAERADVTADYLSRLLYPLDKPGRKNLGALTMRKIGMAFDLSPGWFDAPLGTDLPGAGKNTSPYASGSPPGRTTLTAEANLEDAQRKREPVDWPFTIVTYQRMSRLRQHFGARGMPPALSEIDKHLDVLVTRWENEMNKQKSSAA